MKKLIQISMLFCFVSLNMQAIEAEEDLVQSYKTGDRQNQRENDASWKNFRKWNEMRAAQKAKNQLKNESNEKSVSYDEDNNDLVKSHARFWDHVVFSKEGKIQDRWKEYNAALKVQRQIKARQREIKNTSTEDMSAQFIKGLKKLYEIEALQPKQITSLCSSVISSTQRRIQLFTPDQIKLFNKEQFQVLDLNTLSDKQRKALDQEEIPNISKDQIENYNIARFTPEQMAWVTPEQIGWLSKEQIYLLSSSKDQISNLTHDQLAVLRTRISDLSKEGFIHWNQGVRGRINRILNDNINKYHQGTEEYQDSLSKFHTFNGNLVNSL